MGFYLNAEPRQFGAMGVIWTFRPDDTDTGNGLRTDNFNIIWLGY